MFSDTPGEDLFAFDEKKYSFDASAESGALSAAHMDDLVTGGKKLPVFESPSGNFLEDFRANAKAEADPFADAPRAKVAPDGTDAGCADGGACMAVTDPLSHKINIPMSAIRPTLATSRPGIPSLCLLYLDNRCRQGSQCHQIHADSTVVGNLRKAAKAQPTCCHAHAELHAHRMEEKWLDMTLSFDGLTVSARNMAYTQALARMLQSAPPPSADAPHVIAPMQQICRLHYSDRCRFTEDCRFLHICREVMRDRFVAVVPDLVPSLELRHSARQHGPGHQQQQQQRGSATGPRQGRGPKGHPQQPHQQHRMPWKAAQTAPPQHQHPTQVLASGGHFAPPAPAAMGFAQPVAPQGPAGQPATAKQLVVLPDGSIAEVQRVITPGQLPVATLATQQQLQGAQPAAGQQMVAPQHHPGVMAVSDSQPQQPGQWSAALGGVVGPTQTGNAMWTPMPAPQPTGVPLQVPPPLVPGGSSHNQWQ